MFVKKKNKFIMWRKLFFWYRIYNHTCAVVIIFLYKSTKKDCNKTIISKSIIFSKKSETITQVTEAGGAHSHGITRRCWELGFIECVLSGVLSLFPSSVPGSKLILFSMLYNLNHILKLYKIIIWVKIFFINKF